MMGNLLFDASSLVYALKARRLRPLAGNYIQWLTIYEVMNALWKEASLIRALPRGKVRELVDVFGEVVDLMEVLSPRPWEPDIVEMASRLRLTAYDASYVVLAEKNGLKLVTEDEELKNKASKVIEVLSFRDVGSPEL